MAASGEGFANAGGPKAQPNRAMLAQCVRKFSETPVFLGHNKRTGTRVPSTSRHVLSSKYVYSFGEEFRFVAAAFFGVGGLCALSGRKSATLALRSLITVRRDRRCLTRAV